MNRRRSHSALTYGTSGVEALLPASKTYSVSL
jgi:hypothetical protein